MPKMARIQVPSLKVTVPMTVAMLPADLVPKEGPTGEPILDLVMDGGSLIVRAKLNGRNYRKLFKQIAEHGPENLAVILQGALRSPESPGGPFVLEGAGFQAIVKAPRTPAEPAAEPAAGSPAEPASEPAPAPPAEPGEG